MKSTEILIIEHKLILQALSHLFAAKERMEKDERPPAEFFRMAIGFFQNFADAYHHFKEEYLMFGLLARKKKGELDREIGMLRYEHDRCRNYIAEMENSLDGYGDNDEIATVTLLENLSPYISLLKRHIHKEDNIFFLMVDGELSEEEDQLLVERFNHEVEKMQGTDFMGQNVELVREMAEIVKK
jgi:hemerythrin-like domain-containing protein